MEKDLYKKWLNIPDQYIPPNHYQLLGCRNFETDVDLIMKASRRRVSDLKKRDSDFRENEEISKLMTEISRARVVLRDDKRKKEYDEELRAQGVTEKDDVVISLDEYPKPKPSVIDAPPKPEPRLSLNEVKEPSAFLEPDNVGDSLRVDAIEKSVEPHTVTTRDEPLINLEAVPKKPSPPPPSTPPIAQQAETVQPAGATPSEPGVCDICGQRVSSPSGYLLTTTQVVSTPKYWQHYYRMNKGQFGSLGVSSYKDFCRNDALRANAVQALAGQRTPWLVCQNCISMFDVDRTRLRGYAEQWWRSGRSFEPPGTGPAPTSSVNMEDGIPSAEPKGPAIKTKKKRVPKRTALIVGAVAALLGVSFILAFVLMSEPSEIEQARAKLTELQAKLAEYEQSLSAQDRTKAEELLNKAGKLLNEAKALLRDPDSPLLAEPEKQLKEIQVDAPAHWLYVEAKDLEQQGEYDKAIMKLEEIGVRYPASSFAAKAEDLKKEIEADRKAKTLFDEGLAYENAEQYDEAKKKFLELTTLYPASTFSHQAEEHLAQIETAVRQWDNDAKGLYDSAMNHKAKGNYDAAIELLKKLKEIYPGSKWAAKADKEIAALEQAKLDKYEKAAGESLDKARQSRADKNYDEAITQYRAMLDEFPESKLKEQAQQEMEQTKAEKYEGEAQKLFDEATALFETKKFGEAAELFDKVAKDYPDSKLKEQSQARVTEAREARDAAFQITFQAAKAAFDQKDFSGALRKVLEARGLDLAQDKKDDLSLLYNKILSEIIIGTDGRSINASHLLPRVRSVRDDMEMVLVHEGPFTMGADDGDGDESPMRQVELDAFYIDVHEVTNEQYKQFLNWIALNEHDRRYCHQSEPQGWSHAPQGSDRKHSWTVEAGEFYDYPPGKDRYAVTYVSWYDAYSYAAWAGKSLPTEAQWEKAARGGKAENKYPWGELMKPGCCACTMDSGAAVTPKEAGRLQKGASPYGCFDMAGNVKEWCMDWYAADYYEKGENQNPRGPASGKQRVLRGGSWLSSEHDVQTMNREFSSPDDRSLGLGFRCVVNILK